MRQKRDIHRRQKMRGKERHKAEAKSETESKEREDRQAGPAHSCGHERCCGR